MSDAPRGPDWWQASDGAWYPPNMTEQSLRPNPGEADVPEPGSPLELIYRRVHGIAVLLLSSVAGMGLVVIGSGVTEDDFSGNRELAPAGTVLIAAGGVIALIGVIVAASYILGSPTPPDAAEQRRDGMFPPPPGH